VLVTGDTGCIGSALVGQLRALGVVEIVGVSLDDFAGTRRPGVTQVRLDIRNGPALEALVADVAPDVVFHLAAQRDPGLAEQMIDFTVTTNVLGTRNVVNASRRAGVPQLAYASTGKALRPYTTCVYAASKRISERIVADVAVEGALAASAARFTHVVDNAILLTRLRRWCTASAVVQLHCLDTVFYVQSAIESAQLLLVAALAPRDGQFRVHAIRDLDWPVNLLVLALGAVAVTGPPTGIQVVGHERLGVLVRDPDGAILRQIGDVAQIELLGADLDAPDVDDMGSDADAELRQKLASDRADGDARATCSSRRFAASARSSG